MKRDFVIWRIRPISLVRGVHRRRHSQRWHSYVGGALHRWGVTRPSWYRVHATGDRTVPLQRYGASDMSALTRYHQSRSRALVRHALLHHVRYIYCSDRLSSAPGDMERVPVNCHGYRDVHHQSRVRGSGDAHRHGLIGCQSSHYRWYPCHRSQLLRGTSPPQTGWIVSHSVRLAPRGTHTREIFLVLYWSRHGRPLTGRGGRCQRLESVMMS